jgi:hypothetical protein
MLAVRKSFLALPLLRRRCEGELVREKSLADTEDDDEASDLGEDGGDEDEVVEH